VSATEPTVVLCEPWATTADLPCQDYELDPAQVELWLLFASEVLYELSGRRFPGPCPIIARPCARRRVAPEPMWWPGERRGSMGSCSCNRARRCGCNALDEIDLGPDVVSIEQVRVDGEVVPAVEYGLELQRFLVGYTQSDGQRRTWPCCQDLTAPATAEGTFEVQATRGLMPPRGGIMAAASLACELIASATPDAECRLPKRVTTITRQGVSIAVLDPLTLFAEGRTGLAEVDLWLESQRYGAKNRESVLVDPMAQQRYTTRPTP
jgi:hypothetical protein